jgi:hypothetical protein
MIETAVQICGNKIQRKNDKGVMSYYDRDIDLIRALNK